MARARPKDAAAPPRGRGAARTAAILALLAAVSAGVLWPLADPDRIPAEPDFWQHVYEIGQARSALAEGQLPLRVAPTMQGGLEYPFFQFYSPLPYAIAGAVHAAWSPESAFRAYRLVLLAAIFLGGAFTWRLARRLSGSEAGAVLAGVAYVCAPYLLVNVHARSAWTEAIGQGLLPVVVWYAFRLFEDGDAGAWAGSAISWFALVTTHLITAAYAALLAGVLFGIVAAAGRLRAWPGLVRLAGGLAAGCALAWWQLEPVLLTPLAIKRAGLGNPFDVHVLTSLPTLLSPISRAPPGAAHLLKHTPGLHASVGWVLLAGAAASSWALVRRRCARPALAGGLLAAFAVAFVLAWSPVDLWSALPPVLRVVQFPYRLLAQVAWSGALLVALAVGAWAPARDLDLRWLGAGVACVVLASATWIRTPPGMAMIPAADPMRYQGTTAWIPGRTVQPNGYFMGREDLAGPAYDGPAVVAGACRRQDAAVACEGSAGAATVAVVPAFYFPGLLRVAVNGSPAAYVPVVSGRGVVVGVRVPAGQSRITVAFRGSARANAVSALAWVALAAGGAFAWVRRRRRIAPAGGAAG